MMFEVTSDLPAMRPVDRDLVVRDVAPWILADDDLVAWATLRSVSWWRRRNIDKINVCAFKQ
jgi:hypothetical protein